MKNFFFALILMSSKLIGVASYSETEKIFKTMPADRFVSPTHKKIFFESVEFLASFSCGKNDLKLAPLYMINQTKRLEIPGEARLWCQLDLEIDYMFVQICNVFRQLEQKDCFSDSWNHLLLKTQNSHKILIKEVLDTFPLTRFMYLAKILESFVNRENYSFTGKDKDIIKSELERVIKFINPKYLNENTNLNLQQLAVSLLVESYKKFDKEPELLKNIQTLKEQAKEDEIKREKMLHLLEEQKLEVCDKCQGDQQKDANWTELKADYYKNLAEFERLKKRHKKLSAICIITLLFPGAYTIHLVGRPLWRYVKNLRKKFADNKTHNVQQAAA